MQQHQMKQKNKAHTHTHTKTYTHIKTQAKNLTTCNSHISKQASKWEHNNTTKQWWHTKQIKQETKQSSIAINSLYL